MGGEGRIWAVFSQLGLAGVESQPTSQERGGEDRGVEVRRSVLRGEMVVMVEDECHRKVGHVTCGKANAVTWFRLRIVMASKFTWHPR